MKLAAAGIKMIANMDFENNRFDVSMIF